MCRFWCVCARGFVVVKFCFVSLCVVEGEGGWFSLRVPFGAFWLIGGAVHCGAWLGVSGDSTVEEAQFRVAFW